MRDSSIKSVRLYQHLERVYNELRELGNKEGDPLQVDDLGGLDHLHYHGTHAVDHAIKVTGINAMTSVLEVGSGIGGPARHIAQQTGAKVMALELQADQNTLATEITARCGLSSRISHVCGDVLTYDWQGKSFDVIVSWLTLYHIGDRQTLLQRCKDALRPGGYFYAEDFFTRQPFSDKELEELSREMYAHYLPDYLSYQTDYSSAGFTSLSFEDLSDDWTQFTRSRLAAYLQNRPRHLRVHGESVVNNMELFYKSMARFFKSGKLGGVRVVARKV